MENNIHIRARKDVAKALIAEGKMQVAQPDDYGFVTYKVVSHAETPGKPDFMDLNLEWYKKDSWRWREGEAFHTGSPVSYDGVTYVCTNDHIATRDNAPDGCEGGKCWRYGEHLHVPAE